MLKIIRRHQKKLLAVFTAGLMIVFVADVGIKQLMPQERVDPRGRLVGRYTDGDVRINDVRWAELQLQVLDQIRLENREAPSAEQRYFSIWDLAGIPDEAMQDWGRAPVTFALLKAEAERMPAYVSQAEVEQILQAVTALQLPDGRLVSISDVPQAVPQLRASLHDLLLVVTAFNRSADVVKVSQPYVERAAAEESQQITVSVARISANDLIEQAPPPSDEQLRALFEEYAEFSPTAAPTEENPLGFGYRYPDRVTLQYIAIPEDQVRAVVRASKDEYEWELEAQRYYQRNQRQFAAPTTQPDEQPTTRPFDEVREDVLERIMTPQVQKLSGEIRQRIESTLTADYQAWAQARTPATAPADAATPAVSSLGVPFDSFEYLERLAASVQQRHGVLPAVASIGDWMSRRQLAEMPGIGRFADEPFELAAPLATTQPAQNRDRDRGARLDLYQPSRALVDQTGDAYVFRLTGVSPSHPPREFAAVHDDVLRDWRIQWAWQQARAEAEALADAARDSSLREAAGQRPVLTAGPFHRYAFLEDLGISFSDIDAQARFVTEAFKLVADLATAGGSQQHPVRVIDVPREHEFFVVQLDALENMFSADELQLRTALLPLRARRSWEQMTARDWFTLQGVASRMNYTMADESEEDPPDDDPRAAAALP